MVFDPSGGNEVGHRAAQPDGQHVATFKPVKEATSSWTGPAASRGLYHDALGVQAYAAQSIELWPGVDRG